jgi:Cys-rich protein (TIGR01571 family)
MESLLDDGKRQSSVAAIHFFLTVRRSLCRKYPTSSLHFCRIHPKFHCIYVALMNLFCPCVAIAQVLARIGYSDYLKSLLIMFGVYICFPISCIIYANEQENRFHWFNGITSILAAILFTFMWYLRNKVRFLFHIPGSILEDCCYVLVCGPCSICQIATHVEAYTPGICSFDAKATLPGYVL